MAQIDKPNLHFNTVLYTGDGNTTQAITNTFQTDFSWIKHRGTTAAHSIQDVLRGFSESNKLSSNSADGANNSSGATWGDYGGVSAVGATSFTVYKGSATPYQTNASGSNYVAWNWKANGAGSANSDGATASTVSVNNTAGFSIVKWTGTSGNTTVGHGMNTAPVFTMVKNYSSNGQNWIIYHQDISPDYALKLNTQDAKSNSNNYWQSTAPTNSLLTFTGGTASNANNDYMIGYCFAEKKGYSKFGKYIGNGNANGTFVYTGFKPAFILYRNTSAENWEIHDTKRNPSNLSNKIFYANQNSAEATTDRIDILSNGFKSRTTNSACNTSGTTYIYAAFAENPIVGSNNTPATAR